MQLLINFAAVTFRFGKLRLSSGWALWKMFGSPLVSNFDSTQRKQSTASKKYTSTKNYYVNIFHKDRAHIWILPCLNFRFRAWFEL